MYVREARKREKERKWGERKEGRKRDEMILSGRVRGVREGAAAEAQEGDPLFDSCLSLRLSAVRAFLPGRSHRVSGF